MVEVWKCGSVGNHHVWDWVDSFKTFFLFVFDLLDISQGLFMSWFLNSARLFTFQVFYFRETEYPPKQGRFHGHVEWSGDVLKRDASITLNNVPPTFNGTYICQVRNPPDVHGSNGETILRVVNKGQAKPLVELCYFVLFSPLFLQLLSLLQHAFRSISASVCQNQHSTVIYHWTFSSFSVRDQHPGGSSRRCLRRHLGHAGHLYGRQVLQEEARGQRHRAAVPAARLEG